MFVLVSFPNLRVSEDKVHLGIERLSWMACRSTDSLLASLAVAESAAQHAYVPRPSKFPVPFPENLRVSVHPYTPNHEQRVLWFDRFNWTAFEGGVRAMAPRGQTVGFFATQSNVECTVCASAFGNLRELYRYRANRSVRVLNRNLQSSSVRAGSRPSLAANGEQGKSESSTFHVYVVDTARVDASGDMILQNLESMAPAVFPGIAVLTTRSSRQGSSERLLHEMITAVAAGVYGVADANQYVSASSEVLVDVISRNIVTSLMSVRAAEVCRLLDDIAEYGIDPTKVLSNRQYSHLMQRMNLLIVKLELAREALSTKNDEIASVHYALSAFHDVRAIRDVFGLDANGDPRAGGGFRDPTIRCHFSRVKRGALRAGAMLRESATRHASILTSVFVYTAATCFGFVLSRLFGSPGVRRKGL
jgi:hypothetical protein